MTQLQSARMGIATAEIKAVALEENVALADVVAALANGTAVIPRNIRHKNCRAIWRARCFGRTCGALPRVRRASDGRRARACAVQSDSRKYGARATRLRPSAPLSASANLPQKNL